MAATAVAGWTAYFAGGKVSVASSLELTFLMLMDRRINGGALAKCVV